MPAHTVPPSSMTIQMRQLIHYHIDNNLLTNALFFAERLLAQDPRPSENVHLVALCHLQLGDNASAYETSKHAAIKAHNLGCVYVFAQASLNLQRYQDGIAVLEVRSRRDWMGKNNFGKHTPTSRQLHPDAAAVACLLGKLYEGNSNKQMAVGCYEDALKLNPFMWDAFTRLCDMGMTVRVPNIFKMTPEMESVLRSTRPECVTAPPLAPITESMLSFPPEQDRNRSRPVSINSDTPDPFNNVPAKGSGGGLFGTLGASQKLSESNPSLTNLPAAGGGGIGPEAMETPTGPSAVIDATLVPSRRDHGISAYLNEPPLAPPRKGRTLQGLGMDFSMDVPKMDRAVSSKRDRAPKIHDMMEESAATQALRKTNLAPPPEPRKRTVSGQTVPRQPSEDPGAPQRRSVRLLHQRPTTTKPNPSLPTVGAGQVRELKRAKQPVSKMMRPSSSASTVGRQVSGNRKPMDDSMDVDQREAPRMNYGLLLPQKSTEIESSKQEEAVRFLLELCKKFGSGYFALSQYRSQEALQLYATLPKVHQDTAWVMAQMGRAHYEQAAYADAEKYYKRIRQLAPTRFADMEIYSTILWHLKREGDLAFLAHELIDANWKAPQAWCALGNSWSLSRDHEQALRAFKRATQLDPKFAYGFTLQGHEHVANEEYDKALLAYRNGMSADMRHYNAWYGVGRVYEKLGTYDKAFVHFESAARINPTNAVLTTCIGTVLEKQKQPALALKYYTKATELAPRSSLTRYKKARVLMTIGDMDGAMQELMILKDIAPDAAMVHFQLGKLYKALKNKGSAVKHFTIALNLDPKASQQIKDAIEGLEDTDDEDEPSMMG